MFQWHPIEGDPVPQYRPDDPVTDAGDRLRKYLFPKGDVPLNVVPAMRARIGTAKTIMIVEGTKQCLAAVSHAPDGVLVVGIAGCWGWSRDGVANPELDRIGIDGTPVVVAFDADIDSNPDVHQAATRLGEHLELIGAKTVRYVSLPAGNKVGLDDFLASVADRASVLGRLIDKAGKLGPKPRVKAVSPGAQYFDANGLKVEMLAAAILADDHYSVGPDGAIWRYRDGVYQDCNPMVSAIRRFIGDRFRDHHLRNTSTVVADELRQRGLVLGDHQHAGLVNVRNGMLNVATGKLLPHSPDHLSVTQLPIEWDPTATCTLFDEWLIGRCGTQAEALIEAAGLMLCPWIPQRKIVFLFGPTRSGKSTFLRLLELVAGSSTCSVTLHQLASNRFAAASLFGKLLNSAGDLSDHHVDDLSLLKQLTGDDLVAGEKKYRDSFTFHNTALFVFSANTPPTVSETSRAYVARVDPFLFPHSVEDNEDKTYDARLGKELPGIVTRLVGGARRWLDRGGYMPGNPMVMDLFSQQSDATALFAAEVVAADPGGFTAATAVFDAYKTWADNNGRSRLGRNKFLSRVESTLGTREREHGSSSGTTGWNDLKVLPMSAWVDTNTDLASFASFLSPSPHEEHMEAQEDKTPREGRVGPEHAKDARPDDPVPDPDDIIEMEF